MYDGCLMKTGLPHGRLLGSISLLNYTIEPHYVLEDFRFFYHCYTDDTKIYFTFEGTNKAENKRGLIFNKVD